MPIGIDVVTGYLGIAAGLGLALGLLVQLTRPNS